MMHRWVVVGGPSLLRVRSLRGYRCRRVAWAIGQAMNPSRCPFGMRTMVWWRIGTSWRGAALARHALRVGRISSATPSDLRAAARRQRNAGRLGPGSKLVAVPARDDAAQEAVRQCEHRTRPLPGRRETHPVAASRELTAQRVEKPCHSRRPQCDATARVTARDGRALRPHACGAGVRRAYITQGATVDRGIPDAALTVPDRPVHAAMRGLTYPPTPSPGRMVRRGSAVGVRKRAFPPNRHILPVLAVETHQWSAPGAHPELLRTERVIGDANPFAAEDLIERGRERRVAIADQEPGLRVAGFRERGGDVAGLLGRPGAGRVA
jgi:hypothetical protein